MRILKRSIALIIACLLIISCVPAVYAADASLTYGDFKYTVSDGEVTITKYTGTDASVVIPSKIDEMPVRYIGKYAFSNNSTLTSVELPESLTELCSRAFEGCIMLESVNIPSKLTKISSFTFYSCISLSAIEIPDNITEIEESAFEWCSNLREIDIPSSVKSIGRFAFEGCYNLGKVTLHEGLESIGGETFEECRALEEISLPDSLTQIGGGTFEYCVALKKVKYPEGITAIPSRLFYCCTALKSFDIPDTVTKIGDYAYQNTSLESVIVPDRITKLGNGVFAECGKLKTAVIPEHITKLPEELFSECSALETVTFSSEATSFGKKTFNCCTSLKTITLPDTLTSFGKQCFYCCTSLESINIPLGVTVISEESFEGCGALKSVTVPDSVTSIESSAFERCVALESVTLSKRLKEIRMEAFLQCTALKSIDIPDSVTSCSEGAFKNCSALTEVKIGSKLSVIANYMFYGCSSLTKIEIPTNVTQIKGNAFVNCGALSKIFILNSKTSIAKNSVGFNMPSYNNYEVNPNTAIFGYYQSTAETYANTYGVKFNELSTNPVGVRTIIHLDSDTITMMQYRKKQIVFTVENPGGSTKFVSTNPEVAIVDKNGVIEALSIGTTYIAITNTDATVVVQLNVIESDVDTKHEQQNDDYKYYFDVDEQDNVFVRITKYIGMKSDVVIPQKIEGYPVKVIGEEAFVRLTDGGTFSLRSVVIPEGVEKLELRVFEGCTQLESIKFPSTIKYVADGLFYGKYIVNYSKKVDVDFPSVQAYLDYAKISGDSLLYNLPLKNQFKLMINGKEIKSIEIPEGMASVANYLFYNCMNIESVTLPDGLETVGKYSFYNCTALKSVNLPASLENIDDYAFYGCTSLSEITLPEYLKNLRQYALARSGIKAITFPADTLVWSYACSGCNHLETIIIKSNAVPSSHYGVFSGCGAVKSIYEGYGVAELNRNQTDYFEGIMSNPTGYGYAKSSIRSSCYKNGWEFVLLPDPRQTPDSEGSDLDPIGINPNYFYDAETDTYTMTDKEGSNSGEGAYPNAEAWYAKNVVFDFEKEVCLTQWCTQWIYNVENVVVKGNVLDIDNSAFMFCQNTLKTVELSDNVRLITNGAFNGCDRLTTVKGGKGLKKIGLKAFLGCTALSDISFAESAETIGNSAFSGCTGLSDFKIPDSVKTIGDCAFVNCSGVDEVEIPATVTEIRAHALGYMYNSEQAEYYPIPGFAIVAEKGSAAEKYALENDFKVEYNNHIDPSDTTPKLSASKLTLTAGKVKTLKAYNCTVKTWKSSNSKVVSVKSGKITALKKGTAAITATLTTGKKLTCKVTVSTSPKLSKKTVSVKKGKTVSVKITGKAAAVNNVYTNTKYAKIVSKNNAVTIIVKGLKKGTTTLKIKVNGVVLKLKVKVK